jgi:glycolate oxidase FAD binding subunit
MDGTLFWPSIRDQSHEGFAASMRNDAALWRLSVRSTAPWLEIAGQQIVEWGGALRWVVTTDTEAATMLRAWATAHGGHATLYRGNDKSAGAFQSLASPLLALHRRLKDVFDPQGILNRGRLFAEI